MGPEVPYPQSPNNQAGGAGSGNHQREACGEVCHRDLSRVTKMRTDLPDKKKENSHASPVGYGALGVFMKKMLGKIPPP